MKMNLEKNEKLLLVMHPLPERFKCKLLRKNGATVLESTSCKRTLKRYFLRTPKGCEFFNTKSTGLVDAKKCNVKNQAYSKL